MYFVLSHTNCDQIDFRLVGEACDLNASAARMRYSRLKKAVETGHFRGAILTQGPITKNPKLAAMANPESSRLAEEALKSDANKARRWATNKSTPGISDDDLEDEDAEYELEEEEEEVEEIEPEKLLFRPKRKLTEEPSKNEDDDLFYPDTSVAIHKDKQIKLEGDEEPEMINDRADNASQTSSRGRRSRVPSPPRKSRLSSPRITSQQQFSRRQTSQYTPVHVATRPIPSSNRAMPMPATVHQQTDMVTVGIVSGQPQPTPEDISFAQARGLPSPMQQVSVQQSNNGFPPMRARFARTRQLLPTSSFPSSANSISWPPPPSLSSQFQQPSLPFPLPGAIRSPFASQQPFSPQQRTTPPLSRFDPASVFDNFKPPSITPPPVPRPSTVDILARRSAVENLRKITLDQTEHRNRSDTRHRQHSQRAAVETTPRPEKVVPAALKHSPIPELPRPASTAIEIDMTRGEADKVEVRDNDAGVAGNENGKESPQKGEEGRIESEHDTETVRIDE